MDFEFFQREAQPNEGTRKKGERPKMYSAIHLLGTKLKFHLKKTSPWLSES